MCLNPRKILNPKLRFSADGGHRLYLTVPCGKCAECQKRKLDEYMLRSYYEALDTFNHGGFVLNDTLTYSNDHLPHISDFWPHVLGTSLDGMCFSHQDFRLFFVRLRAELVRRGYHPEHALKYFLAAEYGTSENHSHRPHYHVLFFVTFLIDPFEFSRIVSSCWTFGRTDGLPYKSTLYVRQKRLFSLFFGNGDLVHLQNVVSYVTKYMCKDSRFDNFINEKIDKIIIKKYGDTWTSSSLARQFRANLYRSCAQFHRQSQGFGACALDYLSYDDIFNTGMMSLPDRYSVVRHVNLPTYFARKLFYTLTKDFRNLPCWELNDEGLRYMNSRICKSIRLFELSLNSWFANLPIYLPNNSISYDVTRLLDGRSFADFARYILFYKGRLLPSNLLNDLHYSQCPSIDELLFLSRNAEHFYYLNNLDVRELPVLVSSVGYEDSNFSNYPFDGNRYDLVIRSYQNNFDLVKLPFEDYIPIFFADYYRHKDGVTLDAFSRLHCINQNSFYCFRDFDVLFNLFASSLIHLNNSKQSAYDDIQRLKDVFKSLQTGQSIIY